MQEEQEFTINCPKCGAPMNSDSRYCMKCGYLNINHVANANMKDYIKRDAYTYEVGSGKFMVNNAGNEMRESVATKTGNRLVCFLVNYLFYLFFLTLGFLFLTDRSFQLSSITESAFPIVIIMISLIFFYIYSFELIFIKCNQYWWKFLIPVYNMMVLSEILYQKKWIGLLTLIPIVGFVVFLVMLYHLGKSFQYSGLLTVIFSFVYIPMIAFGVHFFRGYIFVDKESWFNVEREYRAKKIFLFTFLIFFGMGFITVLLTNFSSIKQSTSKIKNYYYVYVSNSLVRKVKRKIEADNIVCDHEYNQKGIYYVSFSDLNEVLYVPFSFFYDSIEGYVRIVDNGYEKEYYVTLSDGKKGFPDTNIEDVKLDIVTDYSSVRKLGKDVNLCKFVN